MQNDKKLFIIRDARIFFFLVSVLLIQEQMRENREEKSLHITLACLVLKRPDIIFLSFLILTNFQSSFAILFPLNKTW